MKNMPGEMNFVFLTEQKKYREEAIDPERLSVSAWAKFPSDRYRWFVRYTDFILFFFFDFDKYLMYVLDLSVFSFHSSERSIQFM